MNKVFNFVTTPKESQMILAENCYIEVEERNNTLRNNNIMLVGASGSGKSRYFVRPNLLQMSSNYVVSDPNG